MDTPNIHAGGGMTTTFFMMLGFMVGVTVGVLGGVAVGFMTWRVVNRYRR
jgi:hypothetical protein